MSIRLAAASKGGMGSPASSGAGRRRAPQPECSWQMATLCMAGPTSLLLIFLFHPAFSSGLSPFVGGRGAGGDGGSNSRGIWPADGRAWLSAARQPSEASPAQQLPQQQAQAVRLVLRYTACAGLMNQHYSHIAAFALAAVLGADLVLAPAVCRDSYARRFG